MGRPSNKVEGRTREEFRALRELVGMSRAKMAVLLDVHERSVNKWERHNEEGFYNPPKDAWDILDEARELQLKVIERSLDEARNGEEGQPVRLNYWLSKDSYEQNNPDAEVDWHMANATIRLVANQLVLEGYTVEFIEL